MSSFIASVVYCATKPNHCTADSIRSTGITAQPTIGQLIPGLTRRVVVIATTRPGENVVTAGLARKLAEHPAAGSPFSLHSPQKKTHSLPYPALLQNRGPPCTPGVSGELLGAVCRYNVHYGTRDQSNDPAHTRSMHQRERPTNRPNSTKQAFVLN